MNAPSLAERLPLAWVVDAEGLAAVVTPSFDLVAGLALEPIDVQFQGEGARAALGEALRSLVSALPDGTTLHVLYRAETAVDAAVCAYAAQARGGEELSPLLRKAVEARAAFVGRKALRTVRLELYCSRGGQAASSLRPPLGMRFASRVDRWTEEQLALRCRALKTLRESLGAQLTGFGIRSQPLDASALRRSHLALLNPLAHLQRRLPQPLAGTLGPDVELATDAEALCFEDVVEHPRHLVFDGRLWRRTLTLKTLPESGTPYFAAEPLTALAASVEGQPEPFAFTLVTTLQVLPQGKAKFVLNAQHGLVEALRNAIPFLADRSVARAQADAAKERSIGTLFEELSELSSKLCTLSVSLAVDALSEEVLEQRTEAAKAAFAACGNSQLLSEEYAQLPAFLSLLPGAGPYTYRKRTCTSRNAADFLPVFAPWRGSARPTSLFQTPRGDLFQLDLFDANLATAHHGLVVADTGSGKSMSLGALTIDALAAGVDAVLIDNGGSWRTLTELFGGTHLDVDLQTSLNPFLEYARVALPDGSVDPEAIAQVGHLLELCVTDRSLAGFDKLQADLVSRAVRAAYAELKQRPAERPVLSHFRAALRKAGTSTEDAQAGEQLWRRLAMFCGDGNYAALLDRPSALRSDARLLTVDVQKVARDPILRSIALAALMEAVTHRAAQRKRRTLVEVDEAHEYLGTGDASERFLVSGYRQMRKHGVGMWCITQNFRDFLGCAAGPTIVDNAKWRLFLRHDGTHQPIIDYFRLSARTAEAFRKLSLRKGHYSDALVLVGNKVATVRLALDPFAYWLLTTDPQDRVLLEQGRQRNPSLSRAALLEALAARYPHGASDGARLRAA